MPERSKVFNCTHLASAPSLRELPVINVFVINLRLLSLSSLISVQLDDVLNAPTSKERNLDKSGSMTTVSRVPRFARARRLSSY